MANISGILSQAAASGNVKPSAIYLDVKNIVGVILAPKGYQLSNTALASQASVIAALQADINNASKASRLYPIFGFEQIQDGSEDITVQTTSIGSRHVVREGYNDWKFEFFTGGLSLLTNLRKFNKQSTAHDFFFMDAGGRIIGMQAKDASGNVIMQAIPSDGGFFWAHPFKMNDGSKLTQYMMQFVFAPRYINELANYVELTDYDLPTTLIGLEDVNLSGIADTTSGSYDIVPKTPTGIYLAANYQTALLQNGAWSAINVNGIPAPGTITPTPSTTGGTLAAGTYYYKVTALNAQGETVGSSEATATTTGSTGSVALAWTAITGATSYKVYRGSSSGGENVYYTTTTNSYTDTGSTGVSASVPTVNTTGGGIIAISAVTAKSDGQTITVALNKTDANYPSVAGYQVAINLANPTALAALATPLTGFESTGAVSIVKN